MDNYFNNQNNKSKQNEELLDEIMVQKKKRDEKNINKGYLLKNNKKEVSVFKQAEVQADDDKVTNIFVAENPINIGKNAYAALAKVLIIAAKSANAGYASTNDWPAKNKPFAVNTLFNPIIRPLATNAGINGTNTSDNVFTNLYTGFIFCVAACFTSFLDDSAIPPVSIKRL